MKKFELLTYPNPILKEVSEPVKKVDKEIQTILDGMLETMYNENGAGIAAPQVGILKRMYILDVDSHIKKNPTFMINPEIVWYSEETKIYHEGCLSFPGGYLEVERPKRVRVQFLDYYGKEQEIEVTDYFARGVQHEGDHLNGVVMTDLKASRLKKDIFLRKIKKYIKLKDKL